VAQAESADQLEQPVVEEQLVQVDLVVQVAFQDQLEYKVSKDQQDRNQL
jgi:hypothetical protein